MIELTDLSHIPHTAMLVSCTIVGKMTGYSRQRIYELHKTGQFPKPIKLQANGASRWRLSDVEQWIEEKAIAGEAA